MAKMSQLYADREDARRLNEGPAHADAPAWVSLIAITLFIGTLAVWARIAEAVVHGGRF